MIKIVSMRQLQKAREQETRKALEISACQELSFDVDLLQLSPARDARHVMPLRDTSEVGFAYGCGALRVGRSWGYPWLGSLY